MLHSPFSQERAARVNRLLDEILPSDAEEPQHLHQAMRYVVCQGGKRIRPLLVYAAGEALNAPLHELDRAACAIELIHAYSLTHDDLPAMDDDEMRRGQPSCHKAFDEATAILVGDALQSLAFELLSEGRGPHQLTLINLLAKASGSRGMVGGQSLDLMATHKKINPTQLEKIHQLKTGALIVASVQLGALTAPHCDPALFQELTTIAEQVGLAYQIQDDLFDHQEGNPDNSAPCFVSALGLSECQQLLKQLQQTINAHLTTLPSELSELHALYTTIAHRNY